MSLYGTSFCPFAIKNRVFPQFCVSRMSKQKNFLFLNWKKFWGRAIKKMWRKFFCFVCCRSGAEASGNAGRDSIRKILWILLKKVRISFKQYRQYSISVFLKVLASPSLCSGSARWLYYTKTNQRSLWFISRAVLEKLLKGNGIKVGKKSLLNYFLFWQKKKNQ